MPYKLKHYVDVQTQPDSLYSFDPSAFMVFSAELHEAERREGGRRGLSSRVV